MSPTRFDRTDWLTIAGMGAVVLALHVFGWGVLIFGVAPQHITLGSAGVFGVGLGVTAYLLGVRHAFDADHIAVIDNTTRKLVGEGKRSLSAGFWFSLGHSSVVFGLAFLLAIGVRAVDAPLPSGTIPMNVRFDENVADGERKRNVVVYRSTGSTATRSV